MDSPSNVAFNVAAVVNEDNADYHRFLRRGELRLQACGKCGYLRHPARFVCPECLSEESEWKLLSGSATVETFIWYFKNILDRRYTSAWAYQDAPYNVAVIKLAEGPRLISNVDRTSFEQLKAGQMVKASFVPISEDYAILRFVPQ